MKMQLILAYLKKHVQQENEISQASDNCNCCCQGPAKNYALKLLVTEKREKWSEVPKEMHQLKFQAAADLL